MIGKSEIVKDDPTRLTLPSTKKPVHESAPQQIYVIQDIPQQIMFQQPYMQAFGAGNCAANGSCSSQGMPQQIMFQQPYTQLPYAGGFSAGGSCSSQGSFGAGGSCSSAGAFGGIKAFGSGIGRGFGRLFGGGSCSSGSCQ